MDISLSASLSVPQERLFDVSDAHRVHVCDKPETYGETSPIRIAWKSHVARGVLNLIAEVRSFCDRAVEQRHLRVQAL